MKQKLTTFFTKNIPLKIISLVLGIVLFAVLLNIQDPTATTYVEVPVVYTNTELLKTADKLVFLSGPSTVSVQVSARTSQLSAVKPEFFTCYADLTKRDGGNISSQSVRIEVAQVGGEGTILDWNYLRNDPYVTVVLDNYLTKEYTIQAALSEDAAGVQIEEITFSPDTVTISGPSTRFSNLTSVKVPISLAELSAGKGGEYVHEVQLYLYDAQDNIISDTSALTLSTQKTEMSATVANRKTVALELAGEPAGHPAEGYYFDGAVLLSNAVTLFNVESITTDLIRIPLYDIDITGARETLEKTVFLENYLPEGAYTAESEKSVQVVLKIRENEKKVLEFEPESYLPIGEEDDLSYEVTGKATVSVAGKEEIIKDLTAGDFILHIDVSGLTVGVHELELQLTSVPAGVTVTDSNLKVTVKVTEKEEETTSPEETTEEAEESASSNP